MSHRKRRRDQAFPYDDEVLAEGSHHVALAETAPTEEELAQLEKQREDKEREVWEAIREAHYEAIEQLPLTLQRQLFLMRQLDEQSININSKLLPALQKYIKLREEMSTRSVAEPELEQSHQVAPDQVEETAEMSPPAQEPSVDNEQVQSGSSKEHVAASLAKSPRLATPSSLVPGSVPPEPNHPPPETTREILTQVAQMAEQLLRASQEKVNLAQANHDSVERHIRLLDQAIKEQEASLALEEIQSNTGIAIHLPELTAPEYRKKVEDRFTDDYDLDLMDAEAVTAQPEPSKPRKKGPKHKNRAQNSQQDSSSLTITLPPTETVNPSEEIYCYCRQVSFGKMIGCDGPYCKREWFHLGCVGLTESVEGEWYCEDCRPEV